MLIYQHTLAVLHFQNPTYPFALKMAKILTKFWVQEGLNTQGLRVSFWKNFLWALSAYYEEYVRRTDYKGR